MSLSASVTAINRRNTPGTANYPPYSYVQAAYSGLTYTGVDALNAGDTYGEERDRFYAQVQDTFDNQVFGNVPGARFWDHDTGRYYRVRQATTTWGDIQIEGDDDLLIGDAQDFFQGQTYAQVQSHYAGQTYYQVAVRGLA